MEKLSISGFIGVIAIVFLFTGCSNVPSNCTELIKELMQKSFNEASNNDYYIKSVQLVDDPACYKIGSEYGLTLKKGEWYPCKFTVIMNSNGSLGSDLDMSTCTLSECSTKNNSISTNWEWKNHNILWKMGDTSSNPPYLFWKNNQGQEEFRIYKHSQDIENESNPIFYVSSNAIVPKLIYKKSDSIQCSAPATTSKDISDTFFFTKNNWDKWSIMPKSSGQMQIEMQQTPVQGSFEIQVEE